MVEKETPVLHLKLMKRGPYLTVRFKSKYYKVIPVYQTLIKLGVPFDQAELTQSRYLEAGHRENLGSIWVSPSLFKKAHLFPLTDADISQIAEWAIQLPSKQKQYTAALA